MPEGWAKTLSSVMLDKLKATVVSDPTPQLLSPCPALGPAWALSRYPSPHISGLGKGKELLRNRGGTRLVILLLSLSHFYCSGLQPRSVFSGQPPAVLAPQAPHILSLATESPGRSQLPPSGHTAPWGRQGNSQSQGSGTWRGLFCRTAGLPHLDSCRDQR